MEAQSQPSKTAPAEGDRDVIDRELQRQEEKQNAEQAGKTSEKK